MDESNILGGFGDKLLQVIRKRLERRIVEKYPLRYQGIRPGMGSYYPERDRLEKHAKVVVDNV